MSWPMPAYLVPLLCLLAGLAVGALLASLLNRRRSERLHVEVAVLKAQVKTEEQLERDRKDSLEQAAQRLQSSFEAVAGQSLRTNSEIFLKLAREHLGQHQQTAV